MKLSHAVLAFALLVSSTAFAQVNFQSSYGVVTTKTDGRLLITARASTIQGIPVTGHFQIDMPAVALGDLQTGATFAAGGIFKMIITAPVPYTYTGTIEAGSLWTVVAYSNQGFEYYEIYNSFHVISPQGGNVGCGWQSNILTAPFAGSLTIAQALVCNTDVTQPETKKAGR